MSRLSCGANDPGDCEALGCFGSMARVGVRAVHWECWSQCNLTCSFCYRTMSAPIGESDARSLIDRMASGGVRKFVFAGGDPSLRRDIAKLCRCAKAAGMAVELQTNGDVQSATVLEAISVSDSLALSIDAGTAATHDSIRGRRGNFAKNFDLIRIAREMDVPVRVRTVVTTGGLGGMHALGSALAIAGVTSWDLQELSEVGLGITTKVQGVNGASVERLRIDLQQAFPMIVVGTNSSADKRGLYAMIRSDAKMYGTLQEVDVATGFYPISGDALRDHLASLADTLPFSPKAHIDRYK